MPITPRASRPLLHLRVMSEMKMNVFRIAINTPAIRPRRATPRVRCTLWNEQVIAMGRAFIIMPACCAFVAYTHRIPSTRAALFDPIVRVPTILNTGHLLFHAHPQARAVDGRDWTQFAM